MRQGAGPSFDSDSSLVQSKGKLLSGENRSEFDVVTGTLELTATAPPGTQWIVGVPPPDDVTSLLIALYPDGLAAYVAHCAYELYTLPILELAAADRRTPAEVWRDLASEDNAAVFDRLAEQELSTSEPLRWEDLAADERVIGYEFGHSVRVGSGL